SSPWIASGSSKVTSVSSNSISGISKVGKKLPTSAAPAMVRCSATEAPNAMPCRGAAFTPVDHSIHPSRALPATEGARFCPAKIGRVLDGQRMHAWWLWLLFAVGVGPAPIDPEVIVLVFD